MTLAEFKEKYLGRKVEVTEELKTYHFSFMKEPSQATEYSSTDPIIEEMSQSIKQMKLVPRIFLPNECGTMDYRTDRVNVQIDKNEAGEFEVRNIAIG